MKNPHENFAQNQTIQKQKPNFIGFFHENEPYGCFTNWYPAEFDYAGIHFKNAEQFMMFHKVMMFGKYDLAKQIMQTSDPAKCKQIAKQKFPEFDADLWEKTCLVIVKRGVHAKFQQNQSILNILLGTGNALLAECSPYDRKWGIGIDIHDDNRFLVSEWKGSNYLGRILMEVREELRQELIFSKDGRLQYVEARGAGSIPVWKMTAGELKQIPQYHKIIHAYSDTLLSFDLKKCFYYQHSLEEWDMFFCLKKNTILPVRGFYEMKQDIYDTSRRLEQFDNYIKLQGGYGL